MEYEIGDFTSYYGWCKFPGCAFITPDSTTRGRSWRTSKSTGPMTTTPKTARRTDGVLLATRRPPQSMPTERSEK